MDRQSEASEFLSAEQGRQELPKATRKADSMRFYFSESPEHSEIKPQLPSSQSSVNSVSTSTDESARVVKKSTPQKIDISIATKMILGSISQRHTQHMSNQKHHIHSTTPPPYGVRWLGTALDTSRKHRNSLIPTNSNTDALSTGLNACHFISSCSTEGFENKSSSPTLLFRLESNLFVPSTAVSVSSSNTTAGRVVKKQTT